MSLGKRMKLFTNEADNIQELIQFDEQFNLPMSIEEALLNQKAKMTGKLNDNILINIGGQATDKADVQKEEEEKIVMEPIKFKQDDFDEKVPSGSYGDS